MDLSKNKFTFPNTLPKEDFKQKLRTWFENKGIKNKLELYARSQMMNEIQRSCGHTINPAQTNSICPKTQAIKLLIADFLVQEDLIFSLSVLCSEVPFLHNLNHFSGYISHLAKPLKSVSTTSKQIKPKFSNTDVCNILDALGLELNKNEISIIRDKYENSKFNSLLLCLLYMLPILLKKYRNVQRKFDKTRKREKNLKKIAKTEKMKTKQMYSMLENAHSVVQKHKTEMNAIYEKENLLRKNSTIVEEKLSELLKRETKLMNWQNSLELKEISFEKNYESNLEEIENKLKIMKAHEDDLQSKYKTLQEEQAKVNAERDYIAEQKKQMTFFKSHEITKLEEYEQKLRMLQDEVKEISAQNRQRMTDENRIVGNDTRYRFNTQTQSQQTESDVFINIEEYVNLIEKENSLLKLNCNKQRYYINQLTSEIMFLKNQLDYVQKEIEMRNQLRQDEMVNRVAHKLYFPNKYWCSEEKSKKYKQTHEIDTAGQTKYRRRLFDGVTTVPSSDLSSSDNSKRINLTDEIVVADAKNKLKKLENETEALDRNCKNLLNVVSRNTKTLNDKLFGYSSISDSSPSEKFTQFTRLSRSYSDLDIGSLNITPETKQYSNVNLRKFGNSTPDVQRNKTITASDSADSVDHSNPEMPQANSEKHFSNKDKNVTFSKMFLRYRKTKKLAEEKDKKYDISDQESVNKIQGEHFDKPQKSAYENDLATAKEMSNVIPETCTNNSQEFTNKNVDTIAIPQTLTNELRTTFENEATATPVEEKHDDSSTQNNASNQINENYADRTPFERNITKNVSKELFPPNNDSQSGSKSEGVISGASDDSKMSDFWN